MPLEVGQKAPDFRLPSTDGAEVSLGQLRQTSNVVLAFYPKDNTSG